MKNVSRPYTTYGYYLGIPIAFITLMVLSTLGVDHGNTGTLLFIFTIYANINAKKLRLVSKRKYVAPVLLYIANIISLVLLPILFTDLSQGIEGDTYFSLVGLIILPMQIIMMVFFFISANDIKKAYPSMKQDAKESRENYLRIKKNKDQHDD